jgi:ABC-2 type transport system permease protein
MRKLLAIIRKDLLLRFASPSELLFFIIMPVAFTYLLAGGTPSGSEDNRIRLAVVDLAQSPFSAQLIDMLEDSQSVRPDRISLEQAESQFDQRRVSAMLVIPAGLELEALLQAAAEQDVVAAVELRQQPNNINALVAERAVLAVLQRAGSALSIAQDAVAQAEQLRPFASAQERQAFFTETLALAQERMDAAPQRMQVRLGATVDAVEYDPAANSSAGQLITWVFIPLLGISALYAYERSSGTLRRMLTTPTANATFLLGTIGGQMLTALFQMLLLVGFGILVMRLNWGREPLALAVILVSSVLAAAALGTTLGTFVKSESQANGLSIMLGMVMALLGGCWYPLELFPAAAQTAVKVLPTTWAMQGMLDLVLRGRGLAEILPETGVLLGFAAVFFVIGIVRFKYE